MFNKIDAMLEERFSSGECGLRPYDDDGVHIGNDGISDQAVGAQILLHRAVEDQDHQTVTQLGNAVRQADGDESFVDSGIELELFQPEGALWAEKVGKIHDTGQQLRGTGGHCRAKHAHIQPENRDIIQNAVGNRTGGHRDDCQFGIAVGLDEHL